MRGVQPTPLERAAEEAREDAEIIGQSGPKRSECGVRIESENGAIIRDSALLPELVQLVCQLVARL